MFRKLRQTGPVDRLHRYAKRVLHGPPDVLRRIRTRRPELIFLSPSKALNTACRAASVPFRSFRGHLMSGGGISLHDDVIAFPLTQVGGEDRLGEYFFGGLADGTTRTLIREAIHYNGVAHAQSLPGFYLEKHPVEGCIEISRPVLFAGIMFNHFAHFMVESLYRIWAYRAVRQLDPYLLYYPLWGIPRYLERQHFVNQVLSGFGIPVDRIIFVDRVIRMRDVAVPIQRYGYGFLHRPDDAFVEFARTFQFEHKAPAGFENAERVYVARSGLRKRGAQIGEGIFEQYLRDEGYAVFNPERHSLFEQLTVYARARQLIFSEGGAIQSCILLPDLDADVAVICRRRDPRRNISVATACLQGYGKPVLWIDAVQGQYQFGLETWEALADVDWEEVSRQLNVGGFVGRRFRAPPETEHVSRTRVELGEYLREISGDPRFVDYMTKLKEVHPLSAGPSHLIDPRDGSPVWPATEMPTAEARIASRGGPH